MRLPLPPFVSEKRVCIDCRSEVTVSQHEVRWFGTISTLGHPCAHARSQPEQHGAGCEPLRQLLDLASAHAHLTLAIRSFVASPGGTTIALESQGNVGSGVRSYNLGPISFQ